MEIANIVIGIGIVILNLIPMITKRFKWFRITIPVSVILALILIFSRGFL